MVPFVRLFGFLLVLFCKGQLCDFAAPVVINFHPLPQGNVSITRQPQPGCLQFHQIMSRDHAIVTDLRK